MSEQDTTETDKLVQQWKIKKLIKSLEAARGAGTSMISLIIPPKDQIARFVLFIIFTALKIAFKIEI